MDVLGQAQLRRYWFEEYDDDGEEAGHATVIVDGDLATLAILHAVYRREGIGSRLLDRVHAWADRAGLSMWLVAFPVAEGMNQAQLIRWYEARGWLTDDSLHGLMIRWIETPADPEVDAARLADAIARHSTYDYSLIPPTVLP